MSQSAIRKPEQRVLANGLELLVEPTGQLPVVDVDIAIRNAGLLGLVGEPIPTARLLAKVLRMGTSELSREEFDEAIECLGGTLSMDVTLHTLRIRGSVLERNLDAYLTLIGSMLREPALREADFEKAKREADAELSSLLDQDRWLVSRAFRKHLFGEDHPAGWSSAGTHAQLREVTLKHLKDLRDRHIRTGNMVVGIAGPISFEFAERRVVSAFAGLQGGNSHITLPNLPVRETPSRLVRVHKAERNQTQLVVGTLSLAVTDPGYYPMVVANTIFGGTFTSRLTRAIRAERGYSYSVSSRFAGGLTPDAWTIYSHPSSDNLGPCLQEELNVWAAFLEDGPTADEMRFVKSYLQKSHAFEIDTPSKRLDPYVDAAILGLPAEFASASFERTQAVTLAEVRHELERSRAAMGVTVAVLGSSQAIDSVLMTFPFKERTATDSERLIS